VSGVNSVAGGFDSHAPPPMISRGYAEGVTPSFLAARGRDWPPVGLRSNARRTWLQLGSRPRWGPVAPAHPRPGRGRMWDLAAAPRIPRPAMGGLDLPLRRHRLTGAARGPRSHLLPSPLPGTLGPPRDSPVPPEITPASAAPHDPGEQRFRRQENGFSDRPPKADVASRRLQLLRDWLSCRPT